MNTIKWMMLGLALNLSIVGCALREQIITPYNEVMYYNLAYDRTYLKALEAVQEVEGWELSSTDKERGIIVVNNRQFGRLDDADKRVVVLNLKRVGGRQTSLALAAESRSTIGGEELMQQINNFVAPAL